MLYGELGRFSIAFTIKKRIISVWSKLLLDKASKLTHRLYSVLYNNFNNNQYDFTWLQKVISMLDEVGMSNIWTYQHPKNSIWLSKTVYQKLQDQYRQSWLAALNESPKCLNYRIIKTEHKFENYLMRTPSKMRNSFIDYQLCNNKLPIEISRRTNIDRSLRKCDLFNSGTVGDEFHYVLECCFFENLFTTYQ